MLRPTRDEFRELAADHTVVPVWRELLADLITPVAAFARLCGDDEPGFLFESVEHGERWSRWSFVGRNPLATLVLRDGVVSVEGDLPAELPTDQGTCRPCTAASSATSATTSCARSSACPTSPPTPPAIPTP